MEGMLGNLIVQVIAGALGGAGAGKARANQSLGTVGDLIAGAVGGGVGGQILMALLEGAAGSMDLASILRDAVGGGAAGAILVTIVGALKNALAKR
ncbi:MAG: hypothetical protein VX871_06570 [Pseudomonadota bacterium]|nr:hypothetical protein [Pseudomonadota bacterium]